MVTIKGSKDGIQVLLDSDLTLEDAKQQITEKFEATKDFFKSGKTVIRLVSDSFSEFELYLLQGVIKEILVGADISFEDQGEAPAKPPRRAAEEKEELYGVNEGMTRFYQGTIRSGQLVEARGNLVVIGDANPGSELVAGGNIIVMGAARGLVHAGAAGNREAVVVALNLLPTQIRIADIISRCPDGEVARTEWIPEIAYIKDEAVYIEQYLTKKS